MFGIHPPTHPPTQVPHSRAYAGLDEDEEDLKKAAPDAALEAELAAHRAAR
jgi:hypothetical protein